jgi:hypothetical protein
MSPRFLVHRDLLVVLFSLMGYGEINAKLPLLHFIYYLISKVFKFFFKVERMCIIDRPLRKFVPAVRARNCYILYEKAEGVVLFWRVHPF